MSRLRHSALMTALLIGAVAGPLGSLGPNPMEPVPKRPRSKTFTAERKAAAEAKRERKRQRRLKQRH